MYLERRIVVAERGLPDAEAEAMRLVRADGSRVGTSDCVDAILGNGSMR